MTNKYFTTRFAVSTIAEAELLAQRNIWNIIEEIRRSGTKGVTQDQLSRNLKIPYRVQLSIVKDLVKMNLIAPKPSNSKIRRGTSQDPNSLPFIWNSLDQPMPWVENNFFTALRPLIEEDEASLESLLSFMERIVEKVRVTERTRKYFPSERIAEPDDVSREAAEFLDAIFASIYWSIMDRGKDRRIMSKYGWATKKYFESGP